MAAAASLRLPLEEIEASFEAAHPGIDVLINSAASGTLRRQIEAGDAADLFISANERHMQALVDAGRVDAATLRVICGNRLVAGTPAGGQIPLTSLRDESRFPRVALANPRTAPLGEFSRQALQGTGLWDQIEPRLIFAENATQLASYLRLGSVDAVVVYASDWIGLGFAFDESRAVDSTLHTPIRYPAAPVGDAEERDEALLFLDHLAAPAAQRVLSRHGFVPAHSVLGSGEPVQGQR